MTGNKKTSGYLSKNQEVHHILPNLFQLLAKVVRVLFWVEVIHKLGYFYRIRDNTATGDSKYFSQD